MPLASVITQERLGDLLPDPLNPRLTAKVRGQLAGDDLLVALADQFDPLSVADSIARHGYFGSEPLIVWEDDEGEKIVLEGNRRLTALLGLARPDLRARFADHAKWEGLSPPNPITVDTSVPVLLADSREDADAVIGFRHIGGAMAWKPLQRAQFVAHLVDERNQSFDEVADTVGEDEETVRMRYRNQSILTRAANLGRPDVLAAGEKSFGTYSAALNRTGLRDFIDACAIPDVVERAPQLRDDALPRLVELFSWLYGTDETGEIVSGRSPEAAQRKVIRESRELSMLAAVVQREAALEELRRTRDLDAAYALTPAPNTTLTRQLGIAAGNLRAAVASIELIIDDPRTRERADEISALLAELYGALDGIDENSLED